MIFKAASEDRPYHLGPFPLEALPRDRRISGREAARPGVTARQAPPQPDDPFRRALLRYLDLFATRRDGKVADRTAPVPDDPERRAIDIKGGGYFLNASQLGICRIPESAWLRGIVSRPHSHAVVVLVEHGRVPEEDNLARSWTQNGIAESARLRSAEIAICLAGHIRQMGYSARAHVAGHSELDLDRLAVLANRAASPAQDDGTKDVRPRTEEGGTCVAAVRRILSRGGREKVAPADKASVATAPQGSMPIKSQLTQPQVVQPQIQIVRPVQPQIQIVQPQEQGSAPGQLPTASKFCANCGNPLAADAAFCGNCGQAV